MAADIIRQEAFEDIQLAVIEHEGEEWFTAKDIGTALGFELPGKSIIKIYHRNREEFKGLTQVVNMTTSSKTGGFRPQRLTIFNLQAVQKFGFLAQTPRAKAFRHWASKMIAHGIHQMKDHILTLEDRLRKQHGQLLATHREIKRLGKKTAGLPAKITKCLPAPVDPNYVKVHRRDLFHLKHCASAQDPRSVHLTLRHIEALERGERLDPTIEEFPEPHASLLTQEKVYSSHVWRVLEAFGSDPEVKAARREVEYTAIFVSRLQQLYESIHQDMLTYSAMVRGIPGYMM